MISEKLSEEHEVSISLENPDSEPYIDEERASEDEREAENEDMFYMMGSTVQQDFDNAVPADKFIHSDEDDPAHFDYPKTKIGRLRFKIGKVMENIYFRLFTILLIVADLIIVIVDLATGDDTELEDELEIVSRCIITYFVVEVLLRIFYKGPRFFYYWANDLDMLVVFGTFIIDWTLSHYARLGVAGRVIRIFRIIRALYIMFSDFKQFKRATRRLISQNKRRYVKEGFDLDLCYVTERVIAMSFPSSGVRALYRNPIGKVRKFLDTKHQHHYRIYDLCSELNYDRKVFHNRVNSVYIEDHNVPELKDMVEFCKDVRSWLAADEQNVVAVHCKGGKGRTGTMICTYLIHTELFQEAKDSLHYFGERRTDRKVGQTFQGVETPSQSRYVGYYEKVKYDLKDVMPPTKSLKIESVKITSIKGVGNSDGSDMTMEIRQGYLGDCKKYGFKSQDGCKVEHNKGEDYLYVTFTEKPVVTNDVKIRFMSTAKNIPKVYDNCAFYFWFYTAFIEDKRLCLARDEIDNPHKKRAQKVFRETFSIEICFSNVNLSQRP